MSLKARRLLFIIFILAFLVITPLVIAYASGYKFVLGKKVIQKTGMLVLDTKPDGAKIYLNNKPRQLFFKKFFNGEESFIKTPAKIKNLLPGEYDVRLELEGFGEWKKTMTIYPGVSTFAEDINLFKKNLPLKLIDGNIYQSVFSPNKKNLVFSTDKEINILNLKTKKKLILEKDKLGLDSSESKIFLWSPNSGNLIINNILLDLNNLTEKLYLDKFIKIKGAKLRWSGNNKIVFLPKNSNVIKSFNLATKEIKTLYSGQEILDFLVKKNHLFIVNKINKTSNLIVYDISSPQTLRSIDLPSFSDYGFINSKHNQINLYDSKRQILYLIDPFSYIPVREIINNVKYTYWVNKNKLLYANDFEIWIADFQSEYLGQKTLLTRISKQINNIIWHPSDNYVIYFTDNAINIIELDDREKRNITELIKLDKISFASLNEKGDTLYFYARIGSQEGLYELIIQ